MATTLQQALLAEVAIFASGSTGNVASGGNALTAGSFNNQQADATLRGYARGKFRLTATFAAAPNGAIYLYAIKGNSGGTTFETSSVTPPGLPLAAIPVDSTNVSQVRDSEYVDLPAGYWKILANNSAGQQLNAGWSIDLIPATDQGI